MRNLQIHHEQRPRPKSYVSKQSTIEPLNSETMNSDEQALPCPPKPPDPITSSIIHPIEHLTPTPSRQIRSYKDTITQDHLSPIWDSVYQIEEDFDDEMDEDTSKNEKIVDC
ncbi:hypothetical protein FRX31_034826 [Thalictrum thalictroides]|uniref:Uncharacterized protein n=1 Tax=Thalictrum thalictroides TaxID=46969 RepID=A0A7J6USX4_THATH|nr:hypothetical protein FRX31_034826 [Thalictrum thalictroides]